MAVSVDAAAVRAATSDGEYPRGERLLAASAVSGLEPGYGGINADVAEGGEVWQVWVGVVERALTAECDCPDGGGAALCRHAAAAALAAVRAGRRWTAVTGEGAGTGAGPCRDGDSRDDDSGDGDSGDGDSRDGDSGDDSGEHDASGERRLRTLAAGLGHAELVDLVVRHALRDGELAADLADTAASPAS